MCLILDIKKAGIKPAFLFQIWWALTGLNRRHLPCKGSALPAELNAQMNTQFKGVALARQPKRRGPEGPRYKVFLSVGD